MTEAPKLLPCPFCGCDADASHDHTVEENHAYGCRKCGVWFDTFNSDDAIAAWNRRHEAAVAAARKEGMMEAAKIAQSILKAEGTASYIPTAICAAAEGKVLGVSMRITGPNSDGEYWLHLSDTPANESCGINLDCPLGDVARRLLDAAAEASK